MAGHLHLPHHGHHQQTHPTGGSNPAGYSVQPTGELVSVYAESNPNYRLAVKPEGVVLAFKNRRDPQQQWIKVDMGHQASDEAGYPGFHLVNKATGMALKHGTEVGHNVTAELWRPNHHDDSILWSRGKDEGKGYTAVRALTNISLNLDADHGARRYGGIKEGHRLITFSWSKGENQIWQFEPIEAELEPDAHRNYA